MLLILGLPALADSQLLLILGVQAAILLGVLLLILRKNPLGPISALLQLLGERLAEMNARSEHVETSVHGIRTDLTTGISQSRTDESRFFDQVRKESSELRELVTTRLETIGNQAGERHVALMESIHAKLTAIGDALAAGQKSQSEDTIRMKETVETTLSQLGRDLRENTNQLTDEVKGRLQEVATGMNALSEKNEQRLEKLQQSNSSELERMRETVDEKLHATLERRLTESFSAVADRLEKVQSGLGEMKDLAVGVGDLKRVLTNVRARGSMGETQCGAQLDQILSPDQYIRNATIKEGSRECVEFAIRIPNGDQPEMLLPIDVKFPKEDWERLEEALDHGAADEIAAARKSLASTVRNEAKKICDKYIDPPRTTPFALMYLPTEGLFAEVIRVPGLIDELQTHLHVSVAGPTNFVAILNSLQMGFRTVAIQKKGAEVWRVLGAAKMEFQKFGKLMAKVESQVSTVQNTLKDISSKTRTINRTLKDVSALETQPAEVSGLLGIHEQQALPLSPDQGQGPGTVLEMAAEEERVSEN
jgi:DNA recombination protein RmuC